MTVVYDFNLCRLSWVLSSIPTVTDQTLQHFEELQGKLSYIELAFEQMENAVDSFGKDMGQQRKRLKDTQDLYLLCNEATALDDVDDMIAARDTILCVMRTQKALS